MTRKQTTNEREHHQTLKEDQAVSREAIDAVLKALHGGVRPRSCGPIVRYWLGGTGSLDNSDTLDCEKQTSHHHIVSCDMSELCFNPELASADYSKWGFEFAFRIPPYDQDPSSSYSTKHEPHWVISLTNNLGRYVFESGNWLEAYRSISTNDPIRMDTETAVVGVAFVPDPKLSTIETSSGEIQPPQTVGLIQLEFGRLWQDPATKRCQELIDMMCKDNPLLITDLARTESYVQPQLTKPRAV